MTRRFAWVGLVLFVSACSTDDGATAPAAEPDTAVEDSSAAVDDTLSDVATDDDAGVDDTGDTPDISGGDEDTADTVVEPPEIDRLALVDPFVGTGALGFNVAALAPGAIIPFGMVHLSPDTAEENGAGALLRASGYRYEDPYVVGFSHIHLSGVGIADYGNLLFMPSVGAPEDYVDWTQYRKPLNHDGETASPGYYRIDLEGGIRAELTATPRTGAHRYTYPNTEDALITIDVTRGIGDAYAEKSDVTVNPETGEVRGMVHMVGGFTSRFGGFELFFVIRPARSPTAVGTWNGDGFEAGRTTTSGTKSGVVLTFDTSENAEVQVQVGISFVDLDGAEANLNAETGDFDSVLEGAEALWEDALSVATIEGGTDKQRRMFYTTLYRVGMMPHLFEDVDDRYRGLDKEVHTASDFTYYTDLSLWDTYRTFHPLVHLLYPDKQQNFVRSLIAMAEDGGSLPRWPLAVGYGGSMLGNSAANVFADSALHGGLDFDLEAAYMAARRVSMGDVPDGKPGLSGLDTYLANGWVAAEDHEGSVSRTMEYSTNDKCIAAMANLLGETDDAAMFEARSEHWKAHWDEAQGFLVPRTSDGAFEEVNPTQDPLLPGGSYVEGTAWHYLWMVPHDGPGLVEMLGGAAPFTEKLTTFMKNAKDTLILELPNSYYWHGNEPSLLATFMFAYAGRTDLARTWSHWALDANYLLQPTGFAGNDDGGTLSAWYVLAAAGLYPMHCTGSWVMTSPVFDRVTLHRPDGDLVTERNPDPDATPTVNGEPWTDPKIPFESLSGATLVLPASKPAP